VCGQNPQNSSIQYKELPRCGPSRLVRYLVSLYMGVPTVLMRDLRGTPALWILGSPYNLGGLKPGGHSCMVGSKDPPHEESSLLFCRLCGILH
jgi:hypothetical protein